MTGIPKEVVRHIYISLTVVNREMSGKEASFTPDGRRNHSPGVGNTQQAPHDDSTQHTKTHVSNMTADQGRATTTPSGPVATQPDASFPHQTVSLPFKYFLLLFKRLDTRNYNLGRYYQFAKLTFIRLTCPLFQGRYGPSAGFHKVPVRTLENELGWERPI